MTRRNFIKALVLVPVITAAGKIKFQQEINEVNYKHMFYGGFAGGGKTWRMHEAQRKFMEAHPNTKFVFFSGRR